MSTELNEVKGTESTKALSVTRFFNKVPKLQFTQGIGSQHVAGFVQVDREQAAAMIVRLAEFLEEGLER